MPRTTNPTATQIALAMKVPCPMCGAAPGVKCRTKMYQKSVWPPHNDRILLGMPRIVNGGDGT